MHHADAGFDRRRRIPTRHVSRPAGRVSDFHTSGVGSVHAAQHAHQRRFAGAILAHERVNLAAHDLERRTAIRLHGSK